MQLHNHHPTESISTWLLSMVPWFIRLYLHTMTVTITGSSHTKNGMWWRVLFMMSYMFACFGLQCMDTVGSITTFKLLCVLCSMHSPMQ